MKEGKTKSRGKTRAQPSHKASGGDPPYSKPALRSEAFVRALTDAKACLKNPEQLQALFHEAAKKAAAVPREPFKECWPYLQTMLRLVRAHHRGEYDQVSNDAFLWIVDALYYLVDQIDFIPDNTPFLYFLVEAAENTIVLDISL